jgi:hypothetical protein
MAEDYSVDVDFAWLRDADGKTVSLLAWGDSVSVVGTTATKFEVTVPSWRTDPDGSLVRFDKAGFLQRRTRVGGVTRDVAVPVADSQVLRVTFVDVQQGDATLIQTPDGKVITIDGGENVLFARFLASRFPDTAADRRQPIDAMIVSHGDGDHFAGLPEIRDSETNASARKRFFARPLRVFHNGLVKRPSSVGVEAMFGATKKSGGRTVITGLESDLLAVPATEMNKHFKSWRTALTGWRDDAGPIEFRRLARGDDDAFDFLQPEGIQVEVLGPVLTSAGGTPGLLYLRKPKTGVPMAHLEHEDSTSLSDSHTVNGHSLVLRLTYGNVRMMFAGDLNNSIEERLAKDHEDGDVDLTSEVFKVPHHGSHEFTPGFLRAVSPLVSVISSGDESTRTEHIHPRATLVNSLGRSSRDDSGLVFVTEMVAFFQMMGWSVRDVAPGTAAGASFFAFKRTAYGLVRVRTDGRRMLVFTDSGERDIKEAYAYTVASPGAAVPVAVQKVG